MRLPIFMLAALIASGAANAQTDSIGFLSPSKNIACAYFDYDNQNTTPLRYHGSHGDGAPAGRLRPSNGARRSKCDPREAPSASATATR